MTIPVLFTIILLYRCYGSHNYGKKLSVVYGTCDLHDALKITLFSYNNIVYSTHN